MRFFGPTTLMALCALVSTALASGCGYLPSEMNSGGKRKTNAEDQPPVVHTASCSTRARGYRQISFGDLYETTDDRDYPFRPAPNLPSKYDVRAYVWGFDNCMEKGTCSHGDHYWLIGPGPGDDFPTWVVTPQYPRITIESRCRDVLKIGERYRFSFKNGKLVGVSRN